MIYSEIKVTGVKELEKKLGNLKSKVPTVLARAINRAAQKARTETKREVAAKYFISQGGRFTVATGRMNTGVREYITKISIKCACNFA